MWQRTGIQALRWLSPPALFAAAAAAGCARNRGAAQAEAPAGKRSQVRAPDVNYALERHCHGKSKVRVLKVRRGEPTHTVQEYRVATTLWSPVYARTFTEDDNSDLVATDTQKNTVYVVAKKTSATSPEEFGIELAQHFLRVRTPCAYPLACHSLPANAHLARLYARSLAQHVLPASPQP